VEVKLLMDRQDKGLNVPSREKRTKQPKGLPCRGRGNMRPLTDLAPRFGLSLYVGVG
jgi:hypothetical protein